MKPWGVVVFPEGNNAIVTVAREVEHGVVAAAHDDDDVQHGTDYPIAVFYETEFARDREMEGLLRTFPNVMFCPVFLTTGRKTQPNPQATDFTISERGVLPA